MRVHGDIVKALPGEAGDAAIQGCADSFRYLIAHGGLAAQTQMPLAVVINLLIRGDYPGLDGDCAQLRAQVQGPPAIRGGEKAQQVGIHLQCQFAPLRACIKVVVIPACLVHHRVHIACAVLTQPVGTAVQRTL